MIHFNFSSRIPENEWKNKIVTPKVAVVGIVESPNNKLLIIKRKYPPYGFAWPGGMMELGETIDETAIREVYEETGISANPIGILNIISSPDSDPRWHVVIINVVMKINDEKEPKANDDALSANWVDINDKELHPKLISTCLSSLKYYNEWKEGNRQLIEIG